MRRPLGLRLGVTKRARGDMGEGRSLGIIGIKFELNFKKLLGGKRDG
jgi:hypothetical protein